MSETRIIAGRTYTVEQLPPQRAYTRNRMAYKGGRGGRRVTRHTGGPGISARMRLD